MGGELIIGVIIFPILAWLIYTFIKKSPRLCWVFLCLIAIAWSSLLNLWSVAGSADNYALLAVEHPDLAGQIQTLGTRDHLQIPETDIRQKSLTSSPDLRYAYSSGIGKARRIVIASDAIAKLNSDQMSFIASHEIGRYRLNHPLEKILFSLVMFIPLAFGWYRTSQWMLSRWGASWDIPSLADWTSLPLLMLTSLAMSNIQNI